MGENSIINISESRVNDWESKRLSVVRDLSRVPKRRVIVIASNAIGVYRREIDGEFTVSGCRWLRDERTDESWVKRARVREGILSRIDDSPEENNEGSSTAPEERRAKVESVEEAKESRLEREEAVKKAEAENKEEEKESKKLSECRTVTSHSRGFLSSASSSSSSAPSSTRLIQRIFLLFLSLLGTPSSFSSSQQYSTIATRGPVLVSGSFFALVSLLMVVLLRPTMAIPTVGATVASESGASGGTSTSTMNPTFNETNATLARIMERGRGTVVIGANDVDEVRDDEGMNFASVGSTMKTRRRRNVEYTTRQSSKDGENETEEDDDDEEEEEEDEENNDQDEEDAFPASLIPHTRESGSEMRSRLREAELDTIRRSIVEGLGLERIPDPSKANVSQTEYRRAHEEYLTRLQHSRDSGDGRQRRLHTFHPAERSPVTRVDRKRRSITDNHDQHELSTETENYVLHFPIVLPNEDSLVDHATLRLLLDATDTPNELTNRAISLYRIVAEDTREFVTREILSNNDERGPRWIELDATRLSNFWHEENNEKLALELTFESRETGRALGQRDKRPVVSNPALNIFTTSYPVTEDFRGYRRKRRANPERLMSLHKGRRTECRGENKKCCRHGMTVIFKDLKGFEFIVQPKNFDAGYCKGRCPPRYNPAHHHALLQSLIWKEDKRKAPRPCCAPSKLEELEILYFDENDPTKLKISSWKNMKVLECACS